MLSSLSWLMPAAESPSVSPAASTTPSEASAKANEPLTITAENAETLARQQAPVVMAARNQALAASGDARALSAFQYPELTADGNWLYGEDRQTGVGVIDGPDDQGHR